MHGEDDTKKNPWSCVEWFGLQMAYLLRCLLRCRSQFTVTRRQHVLKDSEEQDAATSQSRRLDFLHLRPTHGASSMDVLMCGA
jgi:hypothetical protein